MAVRFRPLAKWAASIIVHALLFITASTSRGNPAGNAIQVIPIAVVEATEQQSGPAAETMPVSSAKPSSRPIEPKPELAAAKQPKDIPADQPQANVRRAMEGNNGSARDQAEPAAVKPPADLGRSSAGAVSGPGYGTGGDWVRNCPVIYPKSAQNEGVEGRVRLTVFLAAPDKVKARIDGAAEDERLNAYALRAVTEAWTYSTPPAPLKFAVTLVFENGKATVGFEGAEPYVREEGRL